MGFVYKNKKKKEMTSDLLKVRQRYKTKTA